MKLLAVIPMPIIMPSYHGGGGGSVNDIIGLYIMSSLLCLIILIISLIVSKDKLKDALLMRIDGMNEASFICMAFFYTIQLMAILFYGADQISDFLK